MLVEELAEGAALVVVFPMPAALRPLPSILLRGQQRGAIRVPRLQDIRKRGRIIERTDRLAIAEPIAKARCAGVSE